MEDEKQSLDIVKDAWTMIEEARKKNVPLRMMGAVAFRTHCSEYASMFNALAREISDIDFAGYASDSEKIEEIIKGFDYKSPRGMLGGLTHPDRLIFYNSSKKVNIDVFLDQLSMCHVINFKNRLEADYPTIPLAELLLEKMQIVEINAKDLKDTLILFLGHDLGIGDNEVINEQLILQLLSNDWGYYYTVTTNLKKVIDYVGTTAIVTESQKKLIEDRIRRLIQEIDDNPKSLKWKMRAKIGNKRKWYADVEEVIQ